MSLPPFPPARMIQLEDGTQIALHERSGDDPVLLLLHGFTDCAESFRLLLPHLGPGRVLLPDLPGHGVSPPLAAMTLVAMADAMAGMLRVCAARPVRVVGHSMGTLVGQILASRHPELVAELTLIAGSLRPESLALADLASRITALPDPLWADHPFFDDWHRSAPSVPADFLARLARSAAAMRRADWLACLVEVRLADLTTSAASLRCPVRLISGDDDPIFSPSHAAALRQAFPRAKVLALRGVGHNPHWDDPARIAMALR